MMQTTDDYFEPAKRVFGQIAAAWDDYNNYWRVGNGFDTLISYLLYVDASEVGIAAKAVDYFNNATKNRGCWFDDFGWWGLALIRASRHAAHLKVDSQRCLKYASMAWVEMNDNAPRVWDDAKSDPRYKAVAPRFAGGCWNNYFYPHSRCPNDEKPCDPTDGLPGADMLCGIQNTVTNALYLALSARLYAATKRELFLVVTKREWEWFSQWFYNSDELPKPELRLLRVDSNSSKVLVRERVSVYAPDSSPLPRVWGYAPGNYWSGDQGLVLSAMVDVVPIIGQSNSLKIAMGLIDGVSDPSDGLVDTRGILQAWKADSNPGSDDPFGADPRDYATGLGVYARFLLYAYEQSEALRAHIQQTQAEFLKANADDVCEQITSGKCPQPPSGTIEQMECWLNQLAVLTAAHAILGNA
jgi:hypothetical protein